MIIAAPASVDTLDRVDGRRIGGCAYAARAAAALGHRVRVVGPVGMDYYADVRAHLLAFGVDTSGLLVGGWRTREVMIEASDELVDQRTDVLHGGQPPQYGMRAIQRLLVGADVVLAFGHAYALAETALDAAPDGAIRAVDLQDAADPLSAASLARRAGWLFVSWPTAHALTGRRVSGEVLRALHRLGTENVVLKLGPGGALVAVRGRMPIEVPALLGAFGHTVGAGDSFDAAFLGEYLTTGDVREAAACATAAAAHVIERGAAGGTKALAAIRARRVPAFSSPERRACIRVDILAPLRTAAERLFATRLADVVDAHGFLHRVVSVPDDWDPPQLDRATDNVLETATVVLAVIDRCRPAAAWVARLADRGAAAIVFWSSSRRPPRCPPGTYVARDEHEILAALYAFASGGRPAWSSLATAFQSEV